MECKLYDSVPVYYDENGAYALDLIGNASIDSLKIISPELDLPQPENIRVYIMCEWRKILMHASPLPRRIALTFIMPFVQARYESFFESAGGWNIPLPNRPAVGIKPPHMLEAAITEIGKRIFLEYGNTEDHVRVNTCHELTHAFTSHLRLPMWINEGLAMLTAEKYYGNVTVIPQTIDIVEQQLNKDERKDYRDFNNLLEQQDMLVTQIVQGYWFVRYLDEFHHDALCSLLKTSQSHEGYLQTLTNQFQLEKDTLYDFLRKEATAKYK